MLVYNLDLAYKYPQFEPLVFDFWAVFSTFEDAVWEMLRIVKQGSLQLKQTEYSEKQHIGFLITRVGVDRVYWITYEDMYGFDVEGNYLVQEEQ